MQALALAYADRCAALVDANERLLDAARGRQGLQGRPEGLGPRERGKQEEPLGRER